MTLPLTDDLMIRPLTLENWDALCALFQQGGEPKKCWCQFWRVPTPYWTTETRDEIRERLRAKVAATPPAPAPGLVAMRGGKAVGWTGVGPREEFARLESSTTIDLPPEPPGGGVWSVMCFAVGRAARGAGVANALLDAAIEHAAASGASILEGYPASTGGARITAKGAFAGTLEMFIRAGFTVAAETRSSAAGFPRVVVRRRLAPGP
jgi:ribosomal protein S18 acetylase RimI-like enzyme